MILARRCKYYEWFGPPRPLVASLSFALVRWDCRSLLSCAATASPVTTAAAAMEFHS